VKRASISKVQLLYTLLFPAEGRGIDPALVSR